jgi:hypothetical protein
MALRLEEPRDLFRVTATARWSHHAGRFSPHANGLFTGRGSESHSPSELAVGERLDPFDCVDRLFTGATT